MGEESLIKYKRLLKEIKTPSLHRRMTAFLNEYTVKQLDLMLSDYVSRLNNTYQSKPEDEFLDGIWEFKRKGTILSTVSTDEIVEWCRKEKEKLYLED